MASHNVPPAAPLQIDRPHDQRHEESMLAVVGHEGLRRAALVLCAKPQVAGQVVEVVRHPREAVLPQATFRGYELGLHFRSQAVRSYTSVSIFRVILVSLNSSHAFR